MGHIYQNRNNKRSNKPTPDTSIEKDCEPDTHESLHISNTDTTHFIFEAIEKMGRIYTEQTGRLPITSSKGKNTCDSCMTMTPK